MPGLHPNNLPSLVNNLRSYLIGQAPVAQSSSVESSTDLGPDRFRYCSLVNLSYGACGLVPSTIIVVPFRFGKKGLITAPSSLAVYLPSGILAVYEIALST